MTVVMAHQAGTRSPTQQHPTVVICDSSSEDDEVTITKSTPHVQQLSKADMIASTRAEAVLARSSSVTDSIALKRQEHTGLLPLVLNPYVPAVAIWVVAAS
jgi:hypothetical protein